MTSTSLDTLRTNLTGPVFPILTPFTEDGSAVDHDALTHYVDRLVAAGAPTVLSTVGTSRFNLLDDDEIRAVNQTITAAAAGRCTVIVAGPENGDTRSNRAFAQHAQASGADAYLALFPERYYGEEAVIDFFEDVAGAVDIGVMIHEMAMRSGFGGAQPYSPDLLERLVAIPNVVGMKEESMDPWAAYRIHRRLGGQCAIIGAGSMRNAMRDFHAGARAYLVGIGSFFPRVALRFHSALMAGDLATAHGIARTYEDPFFDIAAAELGWHVALKETLHLFALMPPFERAPLPRLSPAKRDRLGALVDSLGWRDLPYDHEPEPTP
jgi:dihydrodipicolinate synthase/N-acetylneuraminate lyase